MKRMITAYTARSQVGIELLIDFNVEKWYNKDVIIKTVLY